MFLFPGTHLKSLKSDAKKAVSIWLQQTLVACYPALWFSCGYVNQQGNICICLSRVDLYTHLSY